MKLTRLLAFRLLAGIFFVMVIGITTLTVSLINLQADKYTNYFIDTAMRVSDIIKRSTNYSMLLNRREDIYNIIKTTGSEPGIEGIRIYNKAGQISYSTDETEVGKSVDMNAEACIACHTDGNSRTVTPKNPQLVRYFERAKGERIIGVITPIKNQRSCYEADCHAHSREQTILGVLDVMIPLHELDANLNEFERLYYTGSLALLVVVTLFTGLFLWRMVNVPVHRLREGTEEVMKGNLDHTIDVQTKDEIGSLTKSFNIMTRKLKLTQEELKQLNQTLEERVQRKSEELRKAQANLIQVEKMVSLGMLAATVAHELNNPLEGILTFAKLIKKRVNDPELNEAQKNEITSELTMIANETTRCGNIVKNLLLFSRQKVGEFKSNDIRLLVEQSIKLIDHHLKMNNIALTVQYDDHLPMVDCDAEQIQQALLALQINAVEAMPSGGTLALALRREGEKNVMIEIRDSGTGIRDEDLPHIFEPFYTTKHEGKGTGLGLAVVYGIIERHNGKISVESKPNSGTTFSLLLPIERM
ncbi:MAG: ATP-binding protein [Bacteroidota bacterium]